MQPLAIISSGAATGVGLSAPAACAAIRCAIDGFTETRFMDDGGEWVIGCPVPLDPPVRGRGKLVRLAASAVGECVAALETTGLRGTRLARVPLLLGVAEPDRPGRVEGLDEELLEEVMAAAGVRFHPASAVVPRGRLAGAEAVAMARRLVDTEYVPCCVVAGVDSFLVGRTLAAYEKLDRLLTSRNSDGFIPGEAAAAVVVAPAGAAGEGRGELCCVGVGFGREPATIDSGEPLRAEGLVRAVRAAAADAGLRDDTLADTDYRVTDASGPQYAFKEAALLVSRVLRSRKARYELWHPADCVGEVGAVAGPLAFAVALAAARKGYAPGPRVLCHFSLDGGDRAAMVLEYRDGAAAPAGRAG